jgi:nucleotide-binding universal stress UspA family protein
VLHELRLQGFKVKSAVEQDDPKSAIIDTAARWHADLIVVGAHGYDALERFSSEAFRKLSRVMLAAL